MTMKPEQFGVAGNEETQAAGGEWGEQPMNVGNIERLVSILVGIGLLLLSRRLFVYVTLALVTHTCCSAALPVAVPAVRACDINTVSKRISPPACRKRRLAREGCTCRSDRRRGAGGRPGRQRDRALDGTRTGGRSGRAGLLGIVPG